MRVVFLVGRDDTSTRNTIAAVCRSGHVTAVGILLDTALPSMKQRRKNLARNIRENGWTYPFSRFALALCAKVSDAVNRAAWSYQEVDRIMHKAFPDEAFSLEELGTRFRFPVHKAGNLNGAEAIALLKSLNADLGIVLGTRILKAPLFTVPRLGCINVHKGKVPEYRGMPPGFWELYDGAPSAGVTVHFVDQGLDTGAIVATGTVQIDPMETPASIMEKLDEEGVHTLLRAVRDLAGGTVVPHSQPTFHGKAKMRPTAAQTKELHRKLPHWVVRPALPMLLRNLYVLAIFHSGMYGLVRKLHSGARSRAVIFLHHRVNDYSKDTLTVDRATFAAQLLAISRYYRFITTDEIVDSVTTKRPIPPTGVTIHFDDCYQDILTNGAPILQQLGVPACAFINSGFVGTTRRQGHDEGHYPFQYPNLTADELRRWRSLGFEVGAHTVNHVDLGTTPPDIAKVEIEQCGKDLEKILGERVRHFSYTFGMPWNITETAREQVRAAGYDDLFAAHGGTVDETTNAFDIPRGGAHYETAPVYCLLQIEGITPAQIAASVRRLFRR